MFVGDDGLDGHLSLAVPVPGVDGILQRQAESIAESDHRAEARAGHPSDLDLAQGLGRDAGMTRDHLGGVAAGSGRPDQRAEALPGSHLLGGSGGVHAPCRSA